MIEPFEPIADDNDLWSTLALIPHAVQEVDTKGILVFCNAAHCKMHGFELGELTGRTIWELLASPSARDEFRVALEERTTRHPPPLSYATHHRRKDGSVIDVQIDWTYKYDVSGNVKGFISIVTDITQRIRDREALKTAREILEVTTAKHREILSATTAKLQEEVDRSTRIADAMRQSKRLASVGVLAAGIAHEINNPIGAALSSAETALAVSGDPNSTNMVVECLDNIVHSAKRCHNIVRDLLKFASQEPTEKQTYSLNHVVERALHIVRKVSDCRNVSIQSEMTDDPVNVVVNLLEMEIVIANLLQNAIEASRDNTLNHITVRTKRSGDVALLEVEDEGSGIEEAKLDRIFDPFFTSRKDFGGTGLGLSIVYAIVRDQHGEIEVQSEVGVGTKFVLQLPLAKP